MSGANPDVVTLQDGASDLLAAFNPGAGMLCSSLQSAGRELLAQRAGVDAYARLGKTTGIPFLYPWANRLADFRYTTSGTTVEVPRDPDLVCMDSAGLPMHGVIPGRLNWEPADVRRSSMRARLRWGEADAELFALFPFRHDLEYTASLAAARLLIEITVHACGQDRVPVAFGFHPYLTIPGSSREGWRVRLPAMRRLALDARQIPIAPDEQAAAESMLLADRSFDDGFVEVPERATFSVSGGDLKLELGFVQGYRCAQVYAPDPEPFICFEPMAAPANALRSGQGLTVLEPGQRHTLAFAVGVGGLP